MGKKIKSPSRIKSNPAGLYPVFGINIEYAYSKIMISF